MKNKSLLYGLIGLITGGTLTGLLLINVAQAQSPNHSHDSDHSSHCHGEMGMMNQQQKDQHFIQMMIPHHQVVINIADLALNKTTNPEIKQLAETLKTTQTQEIEEMKTWYKQWYGVEVPTQTNQGGMSANMSGCGMSMNNNNLDSLKNASDFDKVFIQEMIPQHKRAVMMSGMVLNSPHPELRNLAQNIIKTQSEEIEQMNQWLNKLTNSH